MRVMVTGATGFVGQALCRHLLAAGNEVVAVVRRPVSGSFLPDNTPGSVVTVDVGDIGRDVHWSPVLNGVNAVIHLAARVHVLKETSSKSSADFKRVNVEGTLHLARAAAQAGVRRFVFLSSIKVNGDETFDNPFRETDPETPKDLYAQSKWEAERGLLKIARETGLEVVILRPPLVYGLGVGANFMRLMQWVQSGVPLPFGRVGNLRSLLYLENLVDAISLCAIHPSAANQIYLVSDGESVSTPELIRLLAAALDKPVRLWGLPPKLLEVGGGLIGKGAEIQRLLGSLEVDSSKIRAELDWKPPFTLREGLMSTAMLCRCQNELTS